MSLIWPSFLFLLFVIPLLIVGYVWVLRRRKRFSLNYSSLALIQDALPAQPRLLRHLPFLLFLLAFSSLTIALARPTAKIPAPFGKPTIMLALDVSLSMCANDIPPNRLTVAQQAAETFISNQAPGTQIGVVAFAGFSELIVPPTENHNELLEAVDNLTAAPRTAIGSAIHRSIDAIAEINEQVAPTNIFLSLKEDQLSDSNSGEMQPDIIILLTDGASNRGADPLNAAQAAFDRGLRVFTIGFGTPEGARFFCTEKQLGDSRFGLGATSDGGFFGGGADSGLTHNINTAIDEDTLRQVAELTQAEFYLAGSEEELLNVFADVPSHLKTIKTATEISAAFSGFGALILLVAFYVSHRWQPLP